ncbi:MAG: efflux RND transporter periplasmic adaptor subunit, partial [Chitinivibrionales bacterium]|nr:efflux RND transporter periplasmic adaptor subunit [Chitinivibrionales bacterium]
MKSKLIVAGTMLILTGGCTQSGENNDGHGAPIRMGVGVTTAEIRTLYRKRSFSGVLEAHKKADLAPMKPGKIRRLPFAIGDYVRKGQDLAVMDDADLVAAVARFRPLRKQYERSQNLYAQKAISKAEFEKIEAEYLAMKRAVDNLEENTTIRAPFSGVVTALAAEEGEVYSPQMNAMPGAPGGLVQIARLDPLKVDCDLDEKTVLKVNKGMQVEVTADVVPDTVFHGKILWVNPRANPVSHTFEIRCT